MTSRDLVKKALKGEPAPRPACGPLATFFCAADAGISLQKFTLSADVQVDCILRYQEKYRPDAVWVSVDTWVTAEALGQDTFVVGCFDQAPFSLACQALGMTSIMTRIIEDRPFVGDLLEKCWEHSLAYAEAMAACGADMLSTGDSPASLLGPDLYKSAALPWEQKLFSHLREHTDKVLSLHVCGDTTAILPYMAGSGARRFVLSSGCILAPETPSENVQALFSAARV